MLQTFFIENLNQFWPISCQHSDTDVCWLAIVQLFISYILDESDPVMYSILNQQLNNISSVFVHCFLDANMNVYFM